MCIRDRSTWEDSRENEKMQDIEELSEEEGGVSTAACSANSNGTMGSLEAQLDFIFESVKKPRIKMCKPKKERRKVSRVRKTEQQISMLEREVNMEDSLDKARICLLYTSPSPRDLSTSRMPSSA
eukprot:TRINITY_DN53849_c0_g1_i1.p2 TRINITY_DN53849_c0_g1~~TRINITY_DN53849_c0_g1_i1.p2  ORF type:complete len:125 (-),score=33.66 TRINITY_DN53849_c0_g1_i1:132-506(-)